MGSMARFRTSITTGHLCGSRLVSSRCPRDTLQFVDATDQRLFVALDRAAVLQQRQCSVHLRTARTNQQSQFTLRNWQVECDARTGFGWPLLPGGGEKEAGKANFNR